MSIDTTQFKSTNVIRSLKSKQVNSESGLVTAEPSNEAPPQKNNRGRKRKYQSDEERIIARRAQQKAYRERKKKELAELRTFKAQAEGSIKTEAEAEKYIGDRFHYVNFIFGG